MMEVAMPLTDREFNVQVASHRMSIGMASEMMCAADCFSRGYVVSKPLCGDSKYDLIVDRQGVLLRVQVKTLSHSNQIPIGYTKYYEDTYGKGSYAKSMPKYDGTEFDILAAVDRETKIVYYLPVEEVDFSKANVSLGLTSDRDRYRNF